MPARRRRAGGPIRNGTGMTRAPILFRVDGTRQQGWESLWRCLTFAAALQRRRRPTYFLSRLDPAELTQNIRRGGSEWLQADHPAGSDESLQQTIDEVRRLGAAAVIVDAPDITGEQLRELRATGTLVLAIDHQAHTT